MKNFRTQKGTQREGEKKIKNLQNLLIFRKWMRILWQIFWILKNVRNMMANLGFFRVKVVYCIFSCIHVLAWNMHCMYKIYLGGSTDFRVFGNIEPKLTKSRPATTTTHEGWMDKWVDGLFYCVLVSLLTIVVSSVVNWVAVFYYLPART
jgi:hypothetical protein